MKTRIFLLSALLFLLLNGTLPAQSLRLQVEIHNIKDPGDTVHVLVWKGEKGFPREKEWALRKKSVRANDTVVSLTFEHLPVGEYAVSCFYDQNNNRKYDRSWLTHSAEPFGLSGHPDYKNLPVKYDDAKFSLRKKNTVVRVYLHYVEDVKTLLGL